MLQHDVDLLYLSKLNFIDLQILSIINKYCYNYIHKKNLFNQILCYNIPNIVIPKDINILQSITLLYNIVIKLLNGYYPYDLKYPEWVNKQKFKIDMCKKIYSHIVGEICYHIPINDSFIIRIDTEDITYALTTPKAKLKSCYDYIFVDDIVIKQYALFTLPYIKTHCNKLFFI